MSPLLSFLAFPSNHDLEPRRHSSQFTTRLSNKIIDCGWYSDSQGINMHRRHGNGPFTVLMMRRWYQLGSVRSLYSLWHLASSPLFNNFNNLHLYSTCDGTYRQCNACKLRLDPFKCGFYKILETSTHLRPLYGFCRWLLIKFMTIKQKYRQVRSNYCNEPKHSR